MRDLAQASARDSPAAGAVGSESSYTSRREIENVEDLRAQCDLLVGADGINSRVRGTYAQTFHPSLDRRLCRFVWLGTTLPLDAFTFIFERTEHGWFTVHAYRFDEELSTFIVECREETWCAHGLESAGTQETLAVLRGTLRTVSPRPPVDGEQRPPFDTLRAGFERSRLAQLHPGRQPTVG